MSSKAHKNGDSQASNLHWSLLPKLSLLSPRKIPKNGRLLFQFRAPPSNNKALLFLGSSTPFTLHLRVENGLKWVCCLIGHGAMNRNLERSRHDERFGRGTMKKNEEKFLYIALRPKRPFWLWFGIWLDFVMWRGSGQLVGTHWNLGWFRGCAKVRIMLFFDRFTLMNDIFCRFDQLNL